MIGFYPQERFFLNGASKATENVHALLKQELGAVALPSDAPIDTVFRADPFITEQAKHRLQRYSMCGLTHTLSTPHVVAELQSYGCLKPYDALVCTSSAAKRVVQSLVGSSLVQLPVIPLPTRVPVVRPYKKYWFTALTAGRISAWSKANLAPVFAALQMLAEQLNTTVQYSVAGVGSTDDEAELAAVAACFPRVEFVLFNGANEEEWQTAWGSADVYIAPSDNVQETFGMATAEAMSLGLPVIATEWAGHSDMIVHRKSGYLLRMTAASFAGPDFTGATATYHRAAAEQTFFSVPQLCSYLFSLTNVQLRDQIGRAAKARYASEFSHEVVCRKYIELFTELRDLREWFKPRSVPSLYESWTAPMPRSAVAARTALDADAVLRAATRSLDITSVEQLLQMEGPIQYCQLSEAQQRVFVTCLKLGLLELV